MKIYYDTTDSFYDGIYKLVEMGVQFQAYAASLHVELTGGY